MMKIRSSKLLSALLAVLMLFSFAAASAPAVFAEGDDEIEVRLPAGNFIAIADGAEMPVLQAGQTVTLPIPLSNHEGGISGITIEPVFPNGIDLTTASTIRQMSRVDRKKDFTLPLDLYISDTMQKGIYTITLNFTFSYLGIPVSEKVDYNVMVESEQNTGAAKAEVLNYKTDPETVVAGENFTLSIDLFNEANVELKNGEICLEGLSNGGFTANGETDKKTFSISPQAARTVTYKLTADKNMSTGSFPLIVRTNTPMGEVTTALYIPVKGNENKNDDPVGQSVPRIIIESYDYGEESAVMGGSTFPLTMRVKNTSASTAIENIKMTISAESSATTGQSGAFTPASSSNTFYFPKIRAGETVSQVIDLMVRSDAVPGSYGINASFEYEAVLDGARVSNLSANETIAIPVIQPNRFEIGELYAWGPIYMGDSGSVMVNYVNKGKTTIYNLQISADGNFTTGEKDNYIGNVESGSGDYFELEYNPMEPGTIYGSLTFTYEDANGIQQETVKEFSVEVMSYDEPVWEDPGMFEDPGMMMEEEPGGFPWKWVIIGGIGVVVIAVVVLIVIKKKKAKVNAEFDDDED